MENSDPYAFIHKNQLSRILIAITSLMAVGYFFVITVLFTRGNPILFWALIGGEAFHLWQVLTFCYTIWNTEYQIRKDFSQQPPVDIFITVTGEPKEIVEETVRAVLNQNYPAFNVFILNDGFVANKDNWPEMEELAAELGITCITRQIPGGAKAGNINNALTQTTSPWIVVFDADHVPYPNFLSTMMAHASDPKVAFVQSPQYYKNHATNYVTGGAWEQQEIFFGAICKGKNRLNAAFMCGTNMLLRRSAIAEVGGMCETNIAEDFLTSLFIHEKGWKSVYVAEVLAEGLAPEDFLSYYKQQYRWARGSLEVIFRYNPLFRRGLNFSQKIQYLASASYYLTGIVILIDALFPLVFFFTGQIPVQISTMTLSAVFLPYILFNIYSLQLATNFAYTFRALAFSLASFTIHIRALIAVLLQQKTSFTVTSKTQITGNFLYLVIPQILYITLSVIGAIFALYHYGVNASVLNNIAWALLNITVYVPFIAAAAPALAITRLKKAV
jgi:cellulose synthase (UDP-forming)